MSTRLQFDFEWRITLFALIMVPALAGLGFWQLARAEEKAVISEAFDAKQRQPAAQIAELFDAPAEALAYRKVQFSGEFRNEQIILLDNRMVQGRYGNEALSVFKLESGELVLVNRGWIVADPARRSLPAPAPVAGTVTISGQVYVKPGRAYVLEEKPLPEGWPKRVQAIRMDQIAEAVASADERLFPYPVRISPGEPGALYADWPIVNVGPAKHYGYAVQWFAMSFVLAVLYFIRSSNVMQLLRGQSPE